jgi:putative SOS response-associated peptidase YedK
MCGRITLTRPNFESIATELNVQPMNYRGMPIFKPRYNLAPTDTLPILKLEDGQRHISPMTWGTIPKNRRGMVINWRAESFPPRSPRCGVITDGFYEWRGPKEARQPHWFHRADHALVVLAGMWKMQQRPDGTFAQAFVVLTTRANAVMEPIHDRMPVVLAESRLDEWMEAKTPEPALRALLRPAPEDWLVAERASPLVNNVKNDGPELLDGLLD